MCYMWRRGSEVGVRELRQNLSVYLDRVKRGETLTVTEHRHVVAVLRPPAEVEDPLGALVAAGIATPARRRPVDLPKPVRSSSGRRMSQIVRDLGGDTV